MVTDPAHWRDQTRAISTGCPNSLGMASDYISAAWIEESAVKLAPDRRYQHLGLAGVCESQAFCNAGGPIADSGERGRVVFVSHTIKALATYQFEA